MWLCEGKLIVKIGHFRLPSASQKRDCLSSPVTRTLSPQETGRVTWPSTEGTNLFALGLAKATFLRPSSRDFRSSSSSRVDRNASLDISSNSLSSLLGLDGIRAKRTCTEFAARAADETSGAFARRAPGHQVSRLCAYKRREMKC